MLSEVPMKLCYRAASMLLLFYCLGHTGGSLSGRSVGREGDAVLEAMRTVRFDFNGVQRTFYDFFFAFSTIVSLYLAASALLAWVLSSVDVERSATVAPIAWGLFAAHVATAILTGRTYSGAPQSSRRSPRSCSALGPCA